MEHTIRAMNLNFEEFVQSVKISQDTSGNLSAETNEKHFLFSWPLNSTKHVRQPICTELITWRPHTISFHNFFFC